MSDCTATVRRASRDVTFEIYTRQESETAIIFEIRARNDDFEIQDNPVERDIRIRRLAHSTISRDFRAIAETDGCDGLQFLRFNDTSSSFLIRIIFSHKKRGINMQYKNAK